MNQTCNSALSSILEFLKTSRRMDCSGYRPSMVQRLIDHRLFKARCRDYVEYLDLIQERQEELDCLPDAHKAVSSDNADAGIENPALVQL